MRPDRSSPAVRLRIGELAEPRKVTLAALSRMLGRPSPYLATFVREGRPERLAEREISDLAAFFGVDPWELGKQQGT